MTLAKRLWLTIAFTACSLLLVLALTAFQLQALSQQFSQYRARQALSTHLNELKASVLELSHADPMLDSTTTQLEKTAQTVQRLRNQIVSALPADQRGDFDYALAHHWTEFTRQIESSLKIAETSPEDAINIPEAAYKLDIVPLIARIDQQLAAEHTGLAAAENAMEASVARLLFAILGPLLATGIAVILLQLAVSKQLKSRIQQMCIASDRLAAGDTQARLPGHNHDELGRAARHINQALDKLLAVMQDVHESALQSEGQSRQVLDLSTRVVEQTRLQIQYSEQSSQVVQWLSKLADNLVAEAHTPAQTLAETPLPSPVLSKVQDTLGEMKRVSQSILDITHIGHLIRDMAEQTSLLAHTATIEATKVRRMTDRELVFFRRADEHYQRRQEQHRASLAGERVM